MKNNRCVRGAQDVGSQVVGKIISFKVNLYVWQQAPRRKALAPE